MACPLYVPPRAPNAGALCRALTSELGEREQLAATRPPRPSEHRLVVGPMDPSASAGCIGFGPAADVGFASDGAGFGAASAMQSGFASAGGIGFGPSVDAVGFGSAAAEGAVGFGAASALQPGFASAGGGGFQTGNGISLGNPANAEMLKRQQAWLFGDADEPDADAGAAGAGARQAAKPAFQTAADKVLTGRPGRAAARPAAPVAPPARGPASGRGARHGLSRPGAGSVSKASCGFKAPGQVGDGARVAAAVAPPRHPTPAAKKGRFNAPRQGRPVLAAAAAPPRPSPMGNRAALPPAAAAAAATRPAGPAYCACASLTPFGERQCPSCCNHCGGRLENQGLQLMHGVGCPNDGCGLIV